MTVTVPNDREPSPGGAALPTSPAPTGASAVATIVGGHLSFYLLIWIGIGAALLAVNLVSRAIAGDVDGSGWDGQAAIFQYAMLAGGVVVVTGYAPVIVTQGVTRRATAAGSLVAVGCLAVAGALATTLAYGVEHLVFALNDWPFVLEGSTADMHIYDRPDQYGLILVEVLALYATHVVAGMVIGTGVSRFGWLWGAPTLLAGVALAVVGEFLVRGGFVGVRLGEAIGLEPPPVAVGVAGAVALTAVGAWGVRRLLGGLPVEIQHASWWR